MSVYWYGGGDSGQIDYVSLHYRDGTRNSEQIDGKPEYADLMEVAEYICDNECDGNGDDSACTITFSVDDRKIVLTHKYMEWQEQDPSVYTEKWSG